MKQTLVQCKIEGWILVKIKMESELDGEWVKEVIVTWALVRWALVW